MQSLRVIRASRRFAICECNERLHSAAPPRSAKSSARHRVPCKGADAECSTLQTVGINNERSANAGRRSGIGRSRAAWKRWSKPKITRAL
ncbi:hypothetical protein QT397_02300 (plasmid) [Microbulbifer sp. MKSA007]|nr:hypothetical protein QT397_02300 [Microbulbifer sp. MKSA007]